MLTTITLVLLVVVGTMQQGSEQNMVSVNDLFNLAFSNMRKAESSGADISELIRKFNEASDLLQQAKTTNFESCSSDNGCIDRANASLLSIINNSRFLEEQAQNSSNYQKMLIFAFYAPLGAFVASAASIFIYSRWNLYRVRKFLDMEIEVK
jgi:hypothetical protein